MKGAGMGGEYRVVSDFPGSFLQKKSEEKRHSCRSGHARRIPTWKEFYGGDLGNHAAALPILQTLASEAST